MIQVTKNGNLSRAVTARTATAFGDMLVSAKHNTWQRAAERRESPQHAH